MAYDFYIENNFLKDTILKRVSEKIINLISKYMIGVQNHTIITEML